MNFLIAIQNIHASGKNLKKAADDFKQIFYDRTNIAPIYQRIVANGENYDFYYSLNKGKTYHKSETPLVSYFYFFGNTHLVSIDRFY